MPPEAPVTVRLKVPAAAVDETASVNVEEALPPAAGVTLVGENVAVTPLGRVLETLSPVAALKPFRLVTVTVDEALPPAAGVTLVGENVAVTPLGRVLETLSPVAALKPFRLVTVTVAEAELPCPTLSELGEIAIEKSGA